MAERFTDKYRELVFGLWYENGKKANNKLIDMIPDENGKKPTTMTIEKWRDGYGWMERADLLDLEVSRSTVDAVIEKRVAMYEKHSRVAEELIDKGVKFLQEHEIQSSSDALKAIALGIEIEKASIGQADVGRRVMRMTDEQLVKELSKLLGKPTTPDSEFVDAEVDEVE